MQAWNKYVRDHLDQVWRAKAQINNQPREDENNWCWALCWFQSLSSDQRGELASVVLHILFWLQEGEGGGEQTWQGCSEMQISGGDSKDSKEKPEAFYFDLSLDFYQAPTWPFCSEVMHVAEKVTTNICLLWLTSKRGLQVWILCLFALFIFGWWIEWTVM